MPKGHESCLRLVRKPPAYTWRQWVKSRVEAKRPRKMGSWISTEILLWRISRINLGVCVRRSVGFSDIEFEIQSMRSEQHVTWSHLITKIQQSSLHRNVRYPLQYNEHLDALGWIDSVKPRPQ